MLRRVLPILIAISLAPVALVAQAPTAPVPDITGKWTSSFDTQIGTQEYSYDFVVKDGVLTGKLNGSVGGEAEITDGKVEGTKVTFTEAITVMDMPITIVYTGEIVSVDEIRFSRNVADFATEELVAKRAK